MASRFCHRLSRRKLSEARNGLIFETKNGLAMVGRKEKTGKHTIAENGLLQSDSAAPNPHAFVWILQAKLECGVRGPWLYQNSEVSFDCPPS